MARRNLFAAAMMLAACMCMVCATGAGAADQDDSLKQILERGKVIVGVAAYIKPLAFTNPETGEIVGLIPDLVSLYAKKLDVEVQYNDYKWAGLFPALDTNKVDFLAAHITTTIPRTAKLNMTLPYVYTGSRILVRKDLPVKDLADLNSDKYTFGESKGSMYVEVVEKQFPKAKLNRYDSFTDSLQAMKAGRIDVTLDDEVIILFSGLKGNDDKFRVLSDNLSPQSYRWACRMGDDQLRRSLDVFFQEIKLSGEYKALYEKWFGIPWEPRVLGY